MVPLVLEMTPPRWSKTQRVASWILAGLFGFMAIAHVVLTVLFYTGVHDTGVGFFFDWEWPAWLIAVIDGAVAWLLWFAYKRGTDRATLALVATLVASILALARAAWMAFVPVLLVVLVAICVLRVVEGRAAVAPS